jgi:hypothetical protein
MLTAQRAYSLPHLRIGKLAKQSPGYLFAVTIVGRRAVISGSTAALQRIVTTFVPKRPLVDLARDLYQRRRTSSSQLKLLRSWWWKRRLAQFR